MGSVLKPFSGLLNPGRLQVPTGQLAIDWSHPLANGLIVCYVPGAMGPVDLCGLVSDPFTAGGTGVGFGGDTQEGPAFICDSTTNPNPLIIIGQRYSQLTSWVKLSLYVRGYQYALVNNFSTYFGIGYANPSADPFTIAQIGSNNTGGLSWNWCNGGAGSGQFFPVGSQSVGPFSYGFTLGGPTGAVAYSNGAFLGSTGGANGTPGSSSTSNIQFSSGSAAAADVRAMTIGCIWNRALSADEMAWIDRYPYDFLIPAEAEMPILLPPAPAFTLMPQILM